MRLVVLFFTALVFALAYAQRPPQPLPYICFSLPEQWCNVFNLSLEKYDTVGNAYYYGVDTSCWSDDPEDVMYGVYFQATSTYTVSFYWNMTSQGTPNTIGQSTVIFQQDSTGNWINALTYANRVDTISTAVKGPDYYLTPRSVYLQRCD